MTLEEGWRLYKAANTEYRRMLVQGSTQTRGDLNGPLARAREKETEALAEYLRVILHLAELARADGAAG